MYNINFNLKLRIDNYSNLTSENVMHLLYAVKGTVLINYANVRQHWQTILIDDTPSNTLLSGHTLVGAPQKYRNSVGFETCACQQAWGLIMLPSTVVVNCTWWLPPFLLVHYSTSVPCPAAVTPLSNEGGCSMWGWSAFVCQFIATWLAALEQTRIFCQFVRWTIQNITVCVCVLLIKNIVNFT